MIERIKRYYNEKSPEDKYKVYLKRKEYLKNYARNRYKTDEKYRNYFIGKQKEYQKKKAEIIKLNSPGLWYTNVEDARRSAKTTINTLMS